MEAEKLLKDKKVYEEVSNSKNILSKSTEVSNKMFSNLKKRGYITEKRLKYFSYEYRKATNFGKLYFLPKFIKGCTMSQVGQLFRIAIHLQKRLEIFRLLLETFNAEGVVVH